MKQFYDELEIEIIEFDNDDIIVTSDTSGPDWTEAGGRNPGEGA